MQNLFIGYPEAKLLDQPKEGRGTKVLNVLLWGDWARVLDDTSDANYIKVICRRQEGWVRRDRTQANRLLELAFVDVGQGDGCFITTPEDRNILIDAGEEDNMCRYLTWRYNLRNNPDYRVPIEYMIMTHSDIDHYGGCAPILDHKQFKVGAILHNGLVERTGEDLLGPLVTGPKGKYVSSLCLTHAELQTLLNNANNRGRKTYPNMLFKAYDRNGVRSISAVKRGDSIPGYGPADPIHLEVLGPVQETVHGAPALRVLGTDGETKNGHSAVLRLRFGKVRILLGGDLNEKSQEFLATVYTGTDLSGPLSEADRQTMIDRGRQVFESDVAKSCHHGSDHFMDDFFSFINPVATIISSGDNETFTHPRPETLGAIGKHSRGDRPLIFSTELARSTEERKLNLAQQLAAIDVAKKAVEAATAPADKEDKKRELDRLLYKLERNVAVYGMITVRTDGERLIIAQKKEQKDAGYIYWKLEPDAQGRMVYKP